MLVTSAQIAFCDLAVRVVAYFLGRAPAARPSRMVTGSDVIRTNRFLQELAEAAAETLADKTNGAARSFDAVGV